MLIFGKELKETTSLQCELVKVLGINKTTCLKLCALLGISGETSVIDLQYTHIKKLKKLCSKYVHVGIRKRIRGNIEMLIECKHYRGQRHLFGLPVRGQRTKTNASTAKRRRYKAWHY